MVTIFCNRLGWKNLELLVGQFQNRLQFGVTRELIDLCRLETLNGQRARILFDAGFDSIAMIANASVYNVENALSNSAPFQSKKANDGESTREVESRSQSRSLWITGMKGVTVKEAAELMIKEAQILLQNDLGISLQFNNNVREDKRSNEFKTPRPVKGKENVNNVLITSPPVIKTPSNSSTPTSVAVNSHKRVTETPTSSRKVPRKSLEHKSPNSILPVTASNRRGNVSEDNEENKLEMSFDLSRQMEEIFEGDMSYFDEPVLTQSSNSAEGDENRKSSPVNPDLKTDDTSDTKKTKKKVSWGGETSQDFFDDDDDDDIFQDSIDIEGLSVIEKKLYSPSKEKKGNKSCPVTPKYQLNSEELDLHLSESSFTTEDEQDDIDKKIDGVNKKVENLDNKIDDDTLSNSFLEAALRTHMTDSELEELEDDDDDDDDKKKDSKASLDTPEVSRKLSKRRKNTKLPKDIKSPGDIISDSENDTSIVAIPSVAQNKGFHVIDVCSSKELFDSFLDELGNVASFSLSVAVMKDFTSSTTNNKIVQVPSENRLTRSHARAMKETPNVVVPLTVIPFLRQKVVGIAFSWDDEEEIAYYLSLSEDEFCCK